MGFDKGTKRSAFERVGGSCLFTGAGRPRARRTGSGTSGAGRRASTLRVAQKASARRRYGGGGGRRPTADGRRQTADGIRPRARLGAHAHARASRATRRSARARANRDSNRGQKAPGATAVRSRHRGCGADRAGRLRLLMYLRFWVAVARCRRRSPALRRSRRARGVQGGSHTHIHTSFLTTANARFRRGFSLPATSLQMIAQATRWHYSASSLVIGAVLAVLKCG